KSTPASGKPAEWSRNPKSVRMPCARMLRTRFVHRNHSSATTPRRNRTWTTARSTRTSRHGGGRRGRVPGRCCVLTSASRSSPQTPHGGAGAAGPAAPPPRRYQPHRLVLPVRRRVQQTAFGPQVVRTGLEAERGVRSNRPVVNLLVVADLLDDVDGEVRVEAETWVEVGQPQEAGDLRLLLRVDVEELVDVGGVDTELPCLDRRDHRPVHGVVPLVVAVEGDRAEGLLGHGLVQDLERVRTALVLRPGGAERR